MKISAVDLFCGVGGLTYGLEKKGINVKYGIDFDLSCKFAYEENNKSRFIHKNIYDLKVPEVNSLFEENTLKVLVGCAPCQPFSNHQKNKFSRERHKDWGLLYEFARIVKGVKPEIISMENVPSLIKEKVFEDFLKVLKKLKYNYVFEIIDAQELGLAQRRRRLILVASRVGKVKFIERNYERKTVKDIIYNLPEISAGETCELDPLHTASKLIDINLRRIKASKQGGTWKDWDESLLPDCYKKKSGATYTAVYGRMSWDSVAPTLTTQFNSYGTGRFGHPEQNRAISLREGAMLQSFPKDYRFIDYGKEFKRREISRQIGNAVPPVLGEYVAGIIIEHLKEVKI